MDFHHYSLIAFQTKFMPEFMVVVGYIFSISTRLVAAGFPSPVVKGAEWLAYSHSAMVDFIARHIGLVPGSLAHTLTPGRIRGVTLAGSRTSPRG